MLVIDKNKKQTYLYLLSGAWILVGIVLSNAYHGENIIELTQPIPPVKPQTFIDLIKHQFVVYSKSTDENMSDALQLTNDLAYVILFGMKNASDMIKSGSVLAYILDIAEENRATSYYREIASLVHNFTNRAYNRKYKSDVAYNVLTGYIEIIRHCNKTAFITWSREAQQAERQLKLTLLAESSITEERINEMTSSSKESLIITRKGWTFYDITLPIKYLLGRMNGLVESSIAKQWNHWDSWVTEVHFSAQFRKFSDKVPERLNLKDNVVVFYVHAC